MRIVIHCAGLLFSAVTAAYSAGQEQTLSRDGRSEYVIVIPNQASPVEQTAARELREHLAQVTGAGWPRVAPTASVRLPPYARSTARPPGAARRPAA